LGISLGLGESPERAGRDRETVGLPVATSVTGVLSVPELLAALADLGIVLGAQIRISLGNRRHAKPHTRMPDIEVVIPDFIWKVNTSEQQLIRILGGVVPKGTRIINARGIVWTWNVHGCAQLIPSKGAFWTGIA
jgi:hypothetical protein